MPRINVYGDEKLVATGGKLGKLLAKPGGDLGEFSKNALQSALIGKQLAESDATEQAFGDIENVFANDKNLGTVGITPGQLRVGARTKIVGDLVKLAEQAGQRGLLGDALKEFDAGNLGRADFLSAQGGQSQPTRFSVEGGTLINRSTGAGTMTAAEREKLAIDERNGRANRANSATGVLNDQDFIRAVFSIRQGDPGYNALTPTQPISEAGQNFLKQWTEFNAGRIAVGQEPVSARDFHGFLGVRQSGIETEASGNVSRQIAPTLNDPQGVIDFENGLIGDLIAPADSNRVPRDLGAALNTERGVGFSPKVSRPQEQELNTLPPGKSGIFVVNGAPQEWGRTPDGYFFRIQ